MALLWKSAVLPNWFPNTQPCLPQVDQTDSPVPNSCHWLSKYCSVGMLNTHRKQWVIRRRGNLSSSRMHTLCLNCLNTSVHSVTGKPSLRSPSLLMANIWSRARWVLNSSVYLCFVVPSHDLIGSQELWSSMLYLDKADVGGL